jgi:hypothetical protein
MMRRTSLVKGAVASCTLALALAAGACAEDNRTTDQLDRDAAATNTTDRAATGTTADARGHEGAPITMTGCLQQGEGMNNYILTGVNRPSESTGTSGTAGTAGNAVEREQIRAATHAFRLEGDNDKLKELVGKQVRVAGTYEEGSDLWRKTQRNDQDERGNVDRSKRNRIEVEQGDLAKVDVNTIEKIADVCGQAASK